jgi:phosphoribosyl 1,2-cyclic phosphodiesterase/CheY-like chemotaxis protein
MSQVLIIDDDSVICLFAETCLSAAGYEVLTALDGETGLRLAVERRPDVVVTDVMMPGIHGFGVVEAIRANPNLAGTKIVVCSMKSYATDIQQAKNAGADRFLAKPYSPEALQEVVAELISGVTPPSVAKDGIAPSVALKTGAFTRDQLGLTATGSTSAGARMRVKFWGTRGSIATPGPGTVRYGGNTSCTEVRFGEHILALDAGTGLREFGNSLLQEFGTKPIRAHLFVGHTHWDHIQGFPFFTPAYVKGNTFSIYSMRGAGKPLEKVFRGQMDVDYFPVVLTDMQARLKFIELRRPVQIGPVSVRFHYLNHPGIAVGFRIEAGGQSVVYTSDHEPFHRVKPGAVSEAEERKVTEFARGADLWIREAQYTEEEYTVKKGWGHSTFDDALLSAGEAQVKSLSIFHHDPMHDDAFLDRVVENLRDRARQAGYTCAVDAAREGQVMEL